MVENLDDITSTSHFNTEVAFTFLAHKNNFKMDL